MSRVERSETSPAPLYPLPAPSRIEWIELTHRSRLINHSCDPTASAKIISINGHSKVSFRVTNVFAKLTLSDRHLRQEHPPTWRRGELTRTPSAVGAHTLQILYDYKFPLETDPALRVPCLCGSKMCRGWLN